jgi:hypothetical protein
MYAPFKILRVTVVLVISDIPNQMYAQQDGRHRQVTVSNSMSMVRLMQRKELEDEDLLSETVTMISEVLVLVFSTM